MTRVANSNGTLNSYAVGPDEVQADDRYGYKVVAVVYDGGMWCAYRGLTDWDDDRVASQGDAIPEVIATVLFPSIAQGRKYENL